MPDTEGTASIFRLDRHRSPRRVREPARAASALARLALAVFLMAWPGCGRGSGRDPLPPPPAKIDASSDTAAGAPEDAARSSPPDDAAAAGQGQPADAQLATPPDTATPVLVQGAWQLCGTIGTGGPVYLDLSRDGSTLAILYSSGAWTIHRTADLALLRAFPADPASWNWASLSADGTLLATTGGGRLRVEHTADGTTVFQAAGDYRLAKFSPDGQQLVVVQDRPSPAETTAQLWSVASGQRVRDYGPAEDVVFAPDGRGVVVHNQVDGHEQLATFQATGQPIVFTVPDSLEMTLLQGHLVVGRRRYQTPASLLAYRLPDGAPLWTAPLPASQQANFHLSTDDTTIFAVDGKQVWTFDAATGAGRPALPPHLYPVVALAMGPPAAPVLVADATGVYRAAPGTLEGGARFPTLPGQGLRIMDVAVSPDGRRLAAVSYSAAPGENVLVWDLPGRRFLRGIRGERATAAVSFSADSSSLLRSFRGIEEYDADREGDPRWRLADAALDPAETWAARYAPGAGKIAFAYRNEVRILSRDGSATVTITTRYPSPGFAFSPDGRTIAVSGPELWTVEGTRLWSAAASAIVPSTGYADNWVAFSPDGTMLIDSRYPPSGAPAFGPPEIETDGARSYATTTGLFRASDGAPLGMLNLPQRPVFSPDGAWIVAGGTLHRLAGHLTFKLPDQRRITVSTFAPDRTIVAGLETGEVLLYCPQ